MIGINSIFAFYNGFEIIGLQVKYLFRDATQRNGSILLKKQITDNKVIFESINDDFKVIGGIILEAFDRYRQRVPRNQIYLQQIDENGTESSLRLPIEEQPFPTNNRFYWYNIDLLKFKKFAFKSLGGLSPSREFDYKLTFTNFKNDDALFVNQTNHTYTDFVDPLFDDNITSNSNYISKNNSEFMVEIGGNYDVVLIMDFSLDTVHKLANANAIYIGKKNGDGTITRIPSEKQTLNSDNSNSYIVTWKNIILTAGTTFVFLFTNIQTFPISFSYNLAFNTRNVF
jgi:hypothetical protein